MPQSPEKKRKYVKLIENRLILEFVGAGGAVGIEPPDGPPVAGGAPQSRRGEAQAISGRNPSHRCRCPALHSVLVQRQK